ncbi:HNH endonuclease [Methanobrevibacter sp.]|uniref:HNH endonuclease n=1 Tax=Methanobrevibacter sp. TaxID=66852 RepID=UPI0038709830
MWKASRTHHVFPFKNFILLHLNLDNGITLCKWCHKKDHAFYNLENTTPPTLLKFFKEFSFRKYI